MHCSRVLQLRPRALCSTPLSLRSRPRFSAARTYPIAAMQGTDKGESGTAPPPSNAAGVKLVALNHVAIATTDVDRARTFYEMLGFRRLNRPDFGFDGAWMIFPGGVPGGSGLMLHIAEEEEDTPIKKEIPQAGTEPRIRRSHHMCFQVADVDVAMAELAQQGIPYSVDAVPGTDIKQVFCYDPDGNGIELSNVTGYMPQLLGQ